MAEIVKAVVVQLDAYYEDAAMDEAFPTVADVVAEVASVSDVDAALITNLIAHHEIGDISQPVVSSLRRLTERCRVALLSNIWSNSDLWTSYFQQIDIAGCFNSVTFSSGVGINKPSPQLFELALQEVGSAASKSVMIGDSYRRDIVPAKSLGMHTIWICEDPIDDHPDADVVVSDFLAVESVVDTLG